MKDIISTFFDIYDTLILLGFIVLILWGLYESLKSYISDVKNNKEQLIKDIILIGALSFGLFAVIKYALSPYKAQSEILKLDKIAELGSILSIIGMIYFSLAALIGLYYMFEKLDIRLKHLIVLAIWLTGLIGLIKNC